MNNDLEYLKHVKLITSKSMYYKINNTEDESIHIDFDVPSTSNEEIVLVYQDISMLPDYMIVDDDYVTIFSKDQIEYRISAEDKFFILNEDQEAVQYLDDNLYVILELIPKDLPDYIINGEELEIKENSFPIYNVNTEFKLSQDKSKYVYNVDVNAYLGASQLEPTRMVRYTTNNLHYGLNSAEIFIYRMMSSQNITALANSEFVLTLGENQKLQLCKIHYGDTFVRFTDMTNNDEVGNYLYEEFAEFEQNQIHMIQNGSIVIDMETKNMYSNKYILDSEDRKELIDYIRNNDILLLIDNINTVKELLAKLENGEITIIEKMILDKFVEDETNNGTYNGTYSNLLYSKLLREYGIEDNICIFTEDNSIYYINIKGKRIVQEVNELIHKYYSLITE